MASSNSTYVAQYTMSMTDYGKILSGYFALPKGVTIQSATPITGGATIKVVFQGVALGSWAAPAPIACSVGLQNIGGQLTLLIQPVGGSSSSSSGF